MHLDFKMWLQVLLLDPNFGGIDLYYFSVDQSWYNGIKLSSSYIITIVKNDYQFSQSIAKQKNNTQLQLQAIIGTWLT